MLIKITRSCHNGCIHCCNDNKPCDDHMTLDTFKDALLFAKKYDTNNIIGNEIAGGEPTEHPLFFEFIDTYYEMYDKTFPLHIATNGHFLLEHPQEIHEYLDKYTGLFFQVTYDSRYYTKKLDITKRVLRHKKIMIVTEIEALYPAGRAITNNLKVSDKVMAPKCYNLKLLQEQLHDCNLNTLIGTLRRMNKFCTPSIQYNGDLAFGEYDSCPGYCNIYDSEEKILDNIKNFDCDGCKEASDIFLSKVLSGELKIRMVK